MKSVIQYAPSIVAGSALAGFGLSFGRDMYRKAKKNLLPIFFLVCLVGIFFSGIWLFRNYRTVWGTIFKKLGALIVLVGSSMIIYGSVFLVMAIFFPEYVAPGHAFDNPITLGTTGIQGFLFLIGSLLGIKHRKKRRQAWEAESHNAAFLRKQGLEVIDTDEEGNLRLRDTQEGIGYHLMENLKAAGELEFMALGKRNRRGYILYDVTGKYTEWTGLVEVR